MATTPGSVKEAEVKALEGKEPKVIAGAFRAASSGQRSSREGERDELQLVGEAAGQSLEFRKTAHLPRTLLGGTLAMRDAGKTYLPIHPAEHSGAWKTRLDSTYLFNGYERALQMLVGKPFGPGGGVTFGDDVLPQVEEWAEDVDLEGRDVSQYSEDWLNESLAVGMAGTLVDFQRNPGGLNRLQEMRLGLRPYFTLVPGDRILGWETARVAGRLVFSRLRWEERGQERVGDWGQRERERVRVLTMGTDAVGPSDWRHWANWMVFEKDDEERWVGPVDGGHMFPFRHIPFEMHYSSRIGFGHARPSLDDLAWKNAEHWVSSSEQRNNLYVARVPLLHGRAFNEDERKARKLIGAMIGWFTESKESSLTYVTGAAEALDPGFRDLDTIKEEMALLSLQPMLDRAPGKETATGRLIDEVSSDSRLQAWVRGLSKSVSNCFDLMAIWGNLGEVGGTAIMDTDFGPTLREVADLREIIQMRQLRELSRETFYGLLQDRNVLPEDFVARDEIRLLATEADDDGEADAEPGELDDESEGDEGEGEG